MRDSELTQRPGRGWTRWATGTGGYEIERVWWQARVLHFPKLNVSCWFDGSDLVGIEHWGGHDQRWCMKMEPADWQPRPLGYLAEAERAWLAYRTAALHRQRHTALLRCRKWLLDPLPRWGWTQP